MARRLLSLSTLLLILSLVAVTSAYLPRTPTGTVPAIRDVDAPASKRQTNRKRIIAKEAEKNAARMIQDAMAKRDAEHRGAGNGGNHGGNGGNGGNHGGNGGNGGGGGGGSWPGWHPKPPKKSGHSYPTCKRGCGYAGIARYKNWDLYGDDLVPNPGYTVNNEEACLQKCYSWDLQYLAGKKDDVCVGSLWLPAYENKCFIKGSNVGSGTFTDTSHSAVGEGTYLDLIGGCAFWSQYVPEAMDKVCCNSEF